MKMFLNSCNPKEIEEALSWGIIGGITMNPTMMSRSGRDFIDLFRQIRAMTELPVFAQVTAVKPEDMLAQGRALASLGRNTVVKVHTNVPGIRGMKLLKQEGIPVCATGIHSVIEAMMVSAVGADYAAVFAGLLAEIDENDSVKLLSNIRKVYLASQTTSKMLAAVRTVGQLVEAAALGVDCATFPFSLGSYVFSNAHTKKRLECFLADWNQAYGNRDWTEILMDQKT